MERAVAWEISTAPHREQKRTSEARVSTALAGPASAATEIFPSFGIFIFSQHFLKRAYSTDQGNRREKCLQQVPPDLWMVVCSGAGKEKSRMNLNSRDSSVHYLNQVLPLQGDGLGLALLSVGCL